MNRKEYHSKWMTLLLVLILVFVVYFMIAVFISGPYYAMKAEDDKVEDVIRKKEKDVVSIERHSFFYVTYVCESEDAFTIYDKSGKRLISRDKKELRLEEVKDIIKKEYDFMNNFEIHIGYGYDSMAYVVENNKKEYVMLDFDELVILYDSWEGKHEID